MSTTVKIRSVYATALTKFLLDMAYKIVGPSIEIQERFGLLDSGSKADILIQDRPDRQGIQLTGHSEVLCPLLKNLQDHLFDAVLMKLESPDDPDGRVRAEIEFPGTAKQTLDQIRSSVIHTLRRHHRLRIVDYQRLDQVEKELGRHPERRAYLETELFQEAVLAPLEKSGQGALEHIRIAGKRIRPREGTIMEVDARRFLLKRTFAGGRYDGLDLPIEDGDYGVTEVAEGAWYLKHTYYSKAGRLIGVYYNINTPIEFYPYGARYVDLEVDVVRRGQEAPFTVDRERLAILGREGFITAKLESHASSVADRLMQEMP
jgi:hypothetical protein